MLLFSGCTPEQPPTADLPDPPTHNGVLRSKVGTLTFNGDGESITVWFQEDFAEQTELPRSERQGTYVFKFQNAAYRYDKAERLEICIDDASYLFQNQWQKTTEETICLSSPLAAGETIQFKKEAARN